MERQDIFDYLIAPLPPKCSLTIILDCCNAGGVIGEAIFNISLIVVLIYLGLPFEWGNTGRRNNDPRYQFNDTKLVVSVLFPTFP